jgi:hypothetical protein
MTEMSTFWVFVPLTRLRLNVDPEFLADCASTFGLDGASGSATIFQSPSTTVNPSGMPLGGSVSKFQPFSEVCAAANPLANNAKTIVARKHLTMSFHP